MMCCVSLTFTPAAWASSLLLDISGNLCPHYYELTDAKIQLFREYDEIKDLKFEKYLHFHSLIRTFDFVEGTPSR